MNALIKRNRRALKHRGWFLVVARGDWYRNDQHLGSFYLIDGNGNVMDHHCNLVTLARDLGVLGEGETAEGHDMPPVEAGRATESVEPADSLAAEAARIFPATIGKVALGGSASFPRFCDGESPCESSFDLTTDG